MVALSSQGTAYQLLANSNRPTLVFIHGLGLTMNTWDAYIEAFQVGYQLLRYDLSGHGQSKIADSVNLSYFARQLIELLDELNIDKVSLIGFSLGGMINRRFAIDYPERLDKLVILNSPHERSAEQQKLVEQRALDTSAGGAATTIDATLERWFTDDFRRHQPNYVASVRHCVLSNEADSYRRCRFVLAKGVIELIHPQPAIDQPTLVITCEHDSGSTPAMSHAIGSEIANAKVIIIADLQHMGLVEQPSLFIEPILQFLQAN